MTTPGSIHEGGELGYVLVHAFGAVMDNPDLLALAVVGDGEAETGPLEGSWKGISFINPEHDGAVLPILHLNGYKIAGPTVLARKDPAEVRSLLEGHGYDVMEVSGDDLPGMHHRFAQTLDTALDKIAAIQKDVRTNGFKQRPHWPLIVLRSPKGWTGPENVDGVQVTDSWRAHQVPLSGVKGNPEHLAILQKWMTSYRPEDLFDDTGAPVELVLSNVPDGDLRMSAAPSANGGKVSKPLKLRGFENYGVAVESPATERMESPRALGAMMRDIYVDNPTSFRVFCPDETNSNRIGEVFEVSDRGFMEHLIPEDVKISPQGRVMEVLSEHNCHGWLEAYTLTGRHGLFATYEAFAMVSASMTIQHGKWLEEARDLDWREPVPSLNILLTSTCWRNDHNGFSHQGPGLIQNVIGGLRHGAASLQLEALFRDAARFGVPAALAGRLEEPGRLRGFGHELYPDGDPRARALLARLEQLDAPGDRLTTVNRVLDAVADRGMPPPNVDVALAALTFCADMPPGSGEAAFALARTSPASRST